jgi:hypothetical protein
MFRNSGAAKNNNLHSKTVSILTHITRRIKKVKAILEHFRCMMTMMTKIVLEVLVVVIRRSHGSSVSFVTDYGLDDRGSIPNRDRGFFFQPLRPDRLWGPRSLLSNGYRGDLSPGLKRGRGVTLTTHPHLLPMLRMSRSYTSSSPKRLHGV